LAYKSNDTSSLRADDTYRADKGLLTERGYFDVFPADDETKFAGTWGNYPFFDSGIVAVTGIEEGLFILKPRLSSSAPPSSRRERLSGQESPLSLVVTRLHCCP
jgi:hypothetical protein